MVVIDSGPARGRGDPMLCTQIAMQSLWNIKVAVLVKPEHENRISHVSTSSVKTGIANTLGEPAVPAFCSAFVLAALLEISPFWRSSQLFHYIVHLIYLPHFLFFSPPSFSSLKSLQPHQEGGVAWALFHDKTQAQTG